MSFCLLKNSWVTSWRLQILQSRKVMSDWKLKLLGKAEHFKDASLLILWYVFASSLWSFGNKGWPLKRFEGVEELLTKAKAFAKNVSGQFYEIVLVEAAILLDSVHDSLSSLKQHLNAAQGHKSTRGEILSARMILDSHLNVNTADYGWDDGMVVDLARFSEAKISTNQVSSETLVYFWNLWKDKIVNIFKYLGNTEKQGAIEYRSYGEFCLNYFGVRRQFNNLNTIYHLMNPDAHWLKELESRFMPSGNFISLDVHQFVSAAQSYWSSELVCAGMGVLDKLEALYSLTANNSSSPLFHQSRLLIHIYAVAKFLLDSKFLKRGRHDKNAVLKFLELSTEHLFGCVYPLGWRESLNENMISIRRSKIFRNLIKECASETVRLKSKQLSYGQLGRISVAILGSGKLCDELYKKIADGLKWNPSWMDLIVELCESNNKSNDLSLKCKLFGALKDAYSSANWRAEREYISPGCFLYLVERQLMLLSYFRRGGYFFSTKSSFTEWLIYLEWDGSPTSKLAEYSPQQPVNDIPILNFLVYVVGQCLYNKNDTMEWIEKSHKNVKEYHADVTLRLAVIACLLSLNFGLCGDLLFELQGTNHITNQLPRELWDALGRTTLKYKKSLNYYDVVLLAQAFKKIGNPLVMVIVNSSNYCSRSCPPDAIYLDMVLQSEQSMLAVLFPNINKGTAHLSEIFQLTNWEDHRNDPTVKARIEEAVHRLSSALDEYCLEKSADSEKASLHQEAAIALDELKQLSAAFDMSESELENGISRIGELVNKLQSRTPRLESFLNHIFSQQPESHGEETSETGKCEEGNSKASEGGLSDEDKGVASGIVHSWVQFVRRRFLKEDPKLF